MKKQIEVHASAGDMFQTVAERAKTEVRGYHKHGSDVETFFMFNGIKCVVDITTDLGHLWRDYCNAHLMDWKEVGPNCAFTYPSDVLFDMANRQKKSEEESAKQQAEYAAKEKAKSEKLNQEIEGVELDIIDPILWQTCQDNNRDGYGAAINAYAVLWGRLMQARMADGSTVAQVAETASHDADIDGMTGFMHGAARVTLVGIWKHGAALKEWHEAERKSIY